LKDFLLHIGAGKTGTSLIQTQLASNRTKLYERGWYYPPSSTDDKALKKMITAGNGLELYLIVKKYGISSDQLQEYINQIITDAKGMNILLSSETLWQLDDETVRILMDITESRGYRLRMAYYIRAIADHFVSSYHQRVKGKIYTGTFEDMIKHQISRMHDSHNFLSTIERMSKLIGMENFIVKNYDRARERLFEEFITHILGIEEYDDFTIENFKINRSLTHMELTLMRKMNRHFEKRTESRFVSDAILHNYPDKKSHVTITEREYRLIEEKFTKDVESLSKYLDESDKPYRLIESVRIVENHQDAKTTLFQDFVIAILAEVIKKILSK
jgi:hypothetical protein